MNTSTGSNPMDWAASVYFADSLAHCTLEVAWRKLWEFEEWNPTFAGAQVKSIKGSIQSEGEVIVVSKKNSGGSEPPPEFYCETVKIVPGRRVVWYAYPKKNLADPSQAEPFRNFIDFGLTQESGGIRFNIYYYAQTRLAGDSLLKEREAMGPLLQDIATAFSEYCKAP